MLTYYYFYKLKKKDLLKLINFLFIKAVTMDDSKGPETRRRSRSKTPFILRSQCNKESCTDADHGHASVIKVPDVM